MERLRNWIEEALGRRYGWPPVCIGYKGRREVYSIDFEDGTSKRYYIDFDSKEIEEVVYD